MSDSVQYLGNERIIHIFFYSRFEIRIMYNVYFHGTILSKRV